MTFETLGATTTTLPSGAVLRREDAVEQQLGSVVGNRYQKDLPHVTVDVALWPRPMILFANKGRFDSLSAEQQAALRGAAKPLVASTTAAVEAEDMSAVAELCADAADLVVAGDDAKAALVTAVRPVYDELEKDAKTASMLARIAEMKAGIPASTSIATCPGPRPHRPRRRPEGSRRAPMKLDSRATSSRPIGKSIRSCRSRTGSLVRW